MDTLNDPAIAVFVETKVRRIADLLKQIYYEGSEMLDEYNAKHFGDTLAASTALIDGTGGAMTNPYSNQPVTKTEVTADQVVGLIYRMQEIHDLLAADNNAKLYSVLAVCNPEVPRPVVA